MQLIASRIGFAAAQATCNPVAYSLIPELFPRNRTAAMAVYNTGTVGHCCCKSSFGIDSRLAACA